MKLSILHKLTVILILPSRQQKHSVHLLELLYFYEIYSVNIHIKGLLYHLLEIHIWKGILVCHHDQILILNILILTLQINSTQFVAKSKLQ